MSVIFDRERRNQPWFLNSLVIREGSPVAFDVLQSALPMSDQNPKLDEASTSLGLQAKVDGNVHATLAIKDDIIKVHSSDDGWIEIPRWMLSVR